MHVRFLVDIVLVVVVGVVVPVRDYSYVLKIDHELSASDCNIHSILWFNVERRDTYSGSRI